MRKIMRKALAEAGTFTKGLHQKLGLPHGKQFKTQVLKSAVQINFIIIIIIIIIIISVITNEIIKRETYFQQN